MNFTVSNFTANNITLEWSPPVAVNINGIIRRYVIRYYITEQLGVSENDLPMDILEVNVTGNLTLTTILYDLDNYTVYNISIAAVTIEDEDLEGPAATLSQRTDENGEQLLLTVPLLPFVNIFVLLVFLV